METITQLDELQNTSPSVITIGVFDGVHIGHREIMRVVREHAANIGARAVVVTFDRNPEELINPNHVSPHITTLRRKIELLENQGMDLALVLPVTKNLLEMSPEDFVSIILLQKLGAVQLIVGRDFAFGKGRSGNTALLRQLGRRMGFTVTAIPPVSVEGILVSSTTIRQMLLKGDISTANRLLGYPFVLEGTVVPGKGIGMSFGFPTANILPPPQIIIPASGVYRASVVLEGQTYAGAVNIGTKPTVGGPHTIEIHILDFTGSLYGQNIEIAFHQRLRDEVRFPTTEALKAQIAKDVEQIRQQTVSAPYITTERDTS